MYLAKILLMLGLTTTMGAVFFLKDIVSKLGIDDTKYLGKDILENEYEYKVLNNMTENILNEEKLNSYSLLDAWNNDNISNVKKAADYINSQENNKASFINKYSDKIVNIGENIMNNTIEDAKNNENIKKTVNDNMREYYLTNITDDTILGTKIKDLLSEKTSFVDVGIDNLKNLLDEARNKKQEVLNQQTTQENTCKQP